MPTLPILYSFRRCPYAMRARLALATSGVAFELREVALRSKPADMLAASPKGTVPVLVLPAGQVIDESIDIMRWALDQHDPECWLKPEAGSHIDMLALIGENDGAFKQQLDRYKYPNRYPQESAGDLSRFAMRHRDEGARWLAGLQLRLAAQAWLCGSRACLADMALLPFVRQFAHSDRDWFGAQPWPNVHAWLTAFEASPRYESVMARQPLWQPATA